MIFFRSGEKLHTNAPWLQISQGRGGISYLLNDEFTTDRAAGAVNGTLAEPTGGTRTVVDTGPYLSVNGGKLVTSGGVNYWWPHLRYDATSRVAGKMMVATTLRADNPQVIGFRTSSTSGTGDNNFTGIRLDNNAWADVNTSMRVVGDLVYGTIYQVATILRSTGSYQFIKGGTFTNWTLIWISSSGNTATLYPGITFSNDVYSADNIRIPIPTWLPTPLAYDTFTRADGAIGSSETIGPDGQTTPSLAWTNQVGTSQISSNKIITTALAGGIAIATVPAGADVLASMALVRGTGTPGGVFRYLNSLNYGYAIHNGTNAQLHKVVNGVDTTLVNVAATYAADAVILPICYGTKWRLYYNNAFIGTEQTVGDADLLSGTGVGWYSTDTDSTGDLFTVFARGTGGEYDAALDPYII